MALIGTSAAYRFTSCGTGEGGHWHGGGDGTSADVRQRWVDILKLSPYVGDTDIIGIVSYRWL